MSRPPFASSQTLAVLNAFLERPHVWQYGYDLTRLIGLKSGTLYPLLMRLNDHGLLEAEWHEPTSSGRPPRHAYRLTQDGVAFARSRASAAKARPRAVGAAVTI